MLVRISRHLLLACVLLAVCALSARAGYATPSAGARGAPNALAAVQAVVGGYYLPSISMYTCSRQLPRHRVQAYAPCPMTDRFRSRLLHPLHHSRGVELCGNQYPPRTVRVRAAGTNGRQAHVNAWWDFGRGSYTVTFVVIASPSGWRVDDEYFAGRPHMDVYGAWRGASPCR